MPTTTRESLLLSARLQRLPTTRYTCAFVLLLAGAFIVEAFDIGSLSVILPILKPLMHLSAVQVGMLAASSTVGITIGRRRPGRNGCRHRNHLGGLSTGGLVIWIDRMTDWSGRHIIRGLAGEFMGRLPKDAIQGPPRADWGNRDAATAAYWAQRTAAYHGIVTWSPTIDPERTASSRAQSLKVRKAAMRF